MLFHLHVYLQAALILRVILRPHRDPASRLAWIVVIVALPIIGIFAYLLLGEVNIGRRRADRMRSAQAKLPSFADAAESDQKNMTPDLPARFKPLFRVGSSISGFQPVGGNHAQLLAGSDEAIEALVADIDAARDHVHLLFYIWLPDNNGCKVIEAMKRAAGRGVTCRALDSHRATRAHNQHQESDS